ncbi:hypothetical protein BEWA_048360 [Theileria equi strain WA]|uniref:Uncharacterized protein n=1 Tax=Theileria equi strain WA TaxID=1537102 RepID=L1LAT4_THEEQ|nr:hypothetical protein BEWA_048360 [Theileria equi strain WA]EKX72369.1 hypothetical protein BEWA_048360 [Theileria equi strain WA]|eukprot:XP_004831821.1 hypothetical protein BEWA_048360 [Theileria equi strain WA]
MRIGNRSQYAIGDVFDGQELIIPGDPRNTSRYVLVVPRKDGAKYIRILDRYKGYTGKLKANVLEFLRYPTDLHYTKIQRIPLELDVFYQTPTDVVNAELLVNWQKHNEDVANGRATMDTPENLETIPTKFTIQERMQDEVVLGVVKYNGYIVESRTDGLLNREVTWEGGVEQPRIIILSRYADNHEIRGEHQFVEELDMFESHMNKKRFNSIQ